jgi:hypothetical protein
MFIRSVFTILALFFFGSNLLNAQDTLTRNAISDAISAGNATKLSNYFDASVDLTVPGNEGNFSKKQATQILKFFFQHNPPAEFALEHEALTNDGATYFIGYYKSSGEKTLRAYILMKQLNGGQLIRQLKLE